MTIEDLRAALARRPNPFVLDATWVSDSMIADLRSLLGTDTLQIRDPAVTEQQVQEQRGTGMLLRPTRPRSRAAPARKRARSLTAAQIAVPHEAIDIAPSSLRSARTFAATIRAYDRRYSRAISAQMQHDGSPSALVITGTEARSGWSVAARFWDAGDGMECMIAVGNLPDAVYAPVFRELHWSRSYADVRITEPRLVFASTATAFRGAPLLLGASFSGTLAVGPNLRHLLGADPLVIQGPIKLPRDPGQDPTEDILDLDTYPRRIVDVPPLRIHFTRIRTQVLFDPELGISWPQLAIQGEHLIQLGENGYASIPLWSPLPRDDGLLVLSTPKIWLGQLIGTIDSVHRLLGTDVWLRGNEALTRCLGTLPWLLDHLDVTYDLPSRTTLRLGLTLKVISLVSFTLTDRARSIRIGQVFVECTVLSPGDRNRTKLTVAFRCTATLDGVLEFQGKLSFAQEPWIDAFIPREKGVHLGMLRGMPFLSRARVPVTADDTIYDSFLLRLYGDRIELEALPHPPNSAARIRVRAPLA